MRDLCPKKRREELRFILIFVFVIMFLSSVTSCSKGEDGIDIQPKEELFDVSVNVNKFTQTHEGMGSVKSTKSSLILNYYNYKIFEVTDDLLSNPTFIKSLSFENSVDNNIDLQLPIGKYVFVIYAYNDQEMFDIGQDEEYFSTVKYNSTDGYYTSDGEVYYDDISFEITGNITDNLSLETNLKRNTGSLNVEFSNSIVSVNANIAFVSFHFNTINTYIHNIDFLEYDNTFGYFYIPSDNQDFTYPINEINKYSLNTLPFETKNVRMIFYDASMKELSSIGLENVSVLSNTRTILSGEYVDETYSVGVFNVTVDEIWNTDVTGGF